ncbi:MAG: hypothetical protein ACLUI3_11650 [Christensenellales bacterium]
MFSLGVAMETLWRRGIALFEGGAARRITSAFAVSRATFTSWRTPFGDLSTATDLLDAENAIRW